MTRPHVVWVVCISAVYQGPMRVGYRERLPALPARSGDLTPISTEYPHPGGATHWWGAVSVRMATERDAHLAGDHRPYVLHRGRPVPRPPQTERDHV